MIWFTADLHLGHKNIIDYCGRPWGDTEEMDQALCDIFERNLKAGDVLYVLGDTSFKWKSAAAFIETMKIHGVQCHYVFGNHDDKKTRREMRGRCATASYMRHIKVGEQKITLCHYPMRMWRDSQHGAWNLYGHCHGDIEDIGLQYDVGIDRNDLKPVSFDQLKEIMSAKEQVFINHHRAHKSEVPIHIEEKKDEETDNNSGATEIREIDMGEEERLSYGKSRLY